MNRQECNVCFQNENISISQCLICTLFLCVSCTKRLDAICPYCKNIFNKSSSRNRDDIPRLLIIFIFINYFLLTTFIFLKELSVLLN